MPTSRFFRYELRTTDVAAARGFYREVLGIDLEPEASATLEIAVLHERARAAGARSHWLGHLALGSGAEVDAKLAQLVASGAMQLGPMQQRADGARHAIVRHPIGAMLALSSASALPPEPRIAWHQLATTDIEAAISLTRELFGWVAGEKVVLPDAHGANVSFAWDEAGPAIGGISDSAKRPEVHTQWLFHFAVEDVETVRAAVVAHGGLALPAMTLPDGRKVAACDDPQGAAFGILQKA